MEKKFTMFNFLLSTLFSSPALLSLRSPLNRLSPYILVGKTYALLLLISRGITTSPRRLNCPFNWIYCVSTHKEARESGERWSCGPEEQTAQKRGKKIEFFNFPHSFIIVVIVMPWGRGAGLVCEVFGENKQSAFQDWLTEDKLI